MRKNATTAKRLARDSKGMMNLNVGTSRRMKQKQHFKSSRRGDEGVHRSHDTGFDEGVHRSHHTHQGIQGRQDGLVCAA
jgi:hypothetical protein